MQQTPLACFEISAAAIAMPVHPRQDSKGLAPIQGFLRWPSCPIAAAR
ncbi:hypothetical protein IQ268_01915 [Oculatella sp. LEGE 06141]|nr:hypothetical protein [Oculatella sp. LEGE 06141]MBE9177329.1 hypothetical protein [Oculatella sp. LEGE 06141]